jgi:hypothetical protein
MKQVILIAVLAGAVAGVGASMVTSVLTMPVQSTDRGSAALVDDGSGQLRKDLTELRDENRQLWERVRFLEETQAAAGPPRMPARSSEPVDLAALEREVEQLKAALVGAPGDVSPATFTQVHAALASIEAEKEREREIEREARRIERVDQRMTQLTETLALDAFQSKQLRNVLLDESTRRDQLLNQMREQGDFANAREEMRAFRDEIEASVSQILTPDQMEKYKESGGGDFGRGRGGFFQGRDGGGRGGRGGGNDGNG